MANTNKTKAEILQELESIKGLLLEDDDIPILQNSEIFVEEPTGKLAPPRARDESTSPGQASLFNEYASHTSRFLNDTVPNASGAGLINADTESKHSGLASHPGNSGATQNLRNPKKAAGENPFLPQHIRERLHGNNPPPLFEYEAVKNIVNATKSIPLRTTRPRQNLVDDVIKSLMPQIESELRHRLFAMSIDELERILNESED